jgi:DNA polymerase sigma
MNLERCQPSYVDIENREKILIQLQKQFEKDYPDCNLHAFGSFYNGFGFRESDLDVCIVFKDQREENVCDKKKLKLNFNIFCFLLIRRMKLFI